MGHFNLERVVWAKAIVNGQYYSHVIWVLMILLLQHALIHTKNFLLANKNIRDEGQASWFMKSQESPYNVVSLKIWFWPIQRISHGKIDSNLPDASSSATANLTLNSVYHSTSKIKSYKKFNALHQIPDKISWVVETLLRNVWQICPQKRRTRCPQ